MLRTKLNKAYLKRTFRPILGWTQATPKACFLDPAWDRSKDIYPGMVAQRVTGDLVSLFGAVPGAGAITTPYGFIGLYVGGDGIDEVLDSGINAFVVCVLGPDAEAEILAPAYHSDLAAFTEVPGTDTLLFAVKSGVDQGKLCLSTTTNAGTIPVARLLKVVSSTKIVVGGLSVSDAFAGA